MQNQSNQFKRRSFLQTFNLFNKNAGKENSNESLYKPSKQKKKSILELHFINPNILFMDQVRREPASRVKTAFAERKPTQARQLFSKTCLRSERIQMAKIGIGFQKLENIGSEKGNLIKKRLDEYIKMEKVYKQYQNSGGVKSPA